MEDINFDDLDRKGLIHSYDPTRSRPQHFIDFVKEWGKTTYRSTFFVNFDNFKPYRYFIVLFSKKGSQGKITAWGIADRTKCERVKTKYDNSPFIEAKYGFKSDKYGSFKSLFYYLKIGLFKKAYQCQKINLIKTGKPITSLTSLQTALYVDIPLEMRKEIMKEIKK
jgi:hypothetical protein